MGADAAGSPEWLSGGYERPLEERASYSRSRRFVFTCVVVCGVVGTVALSSGVREVNTQLSVSPAAPAPASTRARIISHALSPLACRPRDS